MSPPSTPAAPHLRLYGYFRSSSSWRVRIALHLKGVPFEQTAIHLPGGEQTTMEHRRRSPMARVPVLELDFGEGAPVQLVESVAICEWLEETFPSPVLLPADPIVRARVRAAVEIVNAAIQPMQNLALLQTLDRHGVSREVWLAQFLGEGLAGLERALAPVAGKHAVGDSISLADVFLVPQMAAARRFHIPLEDCPTLRRLDAAVADHPAFVAAHADAQPDAPPRAPAPARSQ